MRSWILAVTLVVALSVNPAGAAEVSPKTQSTTTTVVDPTTTAATVQQNQIPVNDIIPKPNSGAPPQRRGDRGGSGQLFVFFAMIAAMCGIGLLIRRESKKKLSAR